MNRWLIRSVQIAALAMGGLALTGTAAHADWTSGPNSGLFNGNQSSTTVQMPVNYCGNSLAIFGSASANCSGGAYASNGGSSSGAGGSGDNGSGSSNGYGNTNSVMTHRHHRTHNASMNSIHSNSLNHRMFHNNSFGSTNAADDSGSGGTGGAYAANDAGDWSTGPNAGFLNGNQSSTTFQMPINVSCNSVALFGFASSC